MPPLYRLTSHSISGFKQGSLPPDRGGVDTEAPVSSTRMVTPSSTRQLVQSSRQLANVQVDSVLATSGLTEVQYEEIFLLSHKVQTAREVSPGFHSIVPPRSMIPYGSPGHQP